MADDPLALGGLTDESIPEAVSSRSRKKKDPVAAQNAETAAKREARLSSGGSSEPPIAAASGRATAKEAVKEEKDVKTPLIDKIVAYREKWPDLKSRNKISFRSSQEEIEDELHYIEQQLGKKEGHMGAQLLLVAMSGIEEVTMKHYNPLNLDLTGLATCTRQNQDQFDEILDELFIKYGASMYVGPEMRLAMAVGTMMFTVHTANTNPKVAEQLRRQAPAGATDL